VKPRRPSHATAVAYLALFVALGGTAWAALHVGTSQVVNNSLKSADLRNGKAVGGKDVIPNSLGGRQVDEASLNPNNFLALSGSQPPDECSLSQGAETDCASTSLKLDRRSRILVVASGAEYGTLGRNGAACELRLDGTASIFGSFTNPGEVSLNSDSGATNGFGLTGVTNGIVEPGKHTLSLNCATGSAGTVLHHATIAALAIAARKH
jgi:hypothetical protein